MLPSGSRGRLARSMLLLVVVSAVAAAPAAGASAESPKRVYKARASKPLQARIAGGSQIPITAAPWQVLVTTLLEGGEEGSCGGSILNPTTVVTTAHCVTDDIVVPNRVLLPLEITVDAGVSRFDPTTGLPQAQPGDAEQTVGVTAVFVHPGYPRNLVNGSGTLADFVDDVAVLSLDEALDLSGPAKRPIPLTAQNVVSPVGAAATVTGFGLQSENPDTISGNLFALGETVQDAALTPAGPLNALFVVGVAPAGSFCAGDSGGPLQAGGALLGIVASSASCAGGQPNFYANVSAGEIQQFITGNPSPPLAPRGGQDVGLAAQSSAAPQRGDTLTCLPGTWSNSPSFTYVFVDTSRNRELQRGGSPTYRVTGTSDVGATISCRAIAANAGGVGLTPPTLTPPPVLAPRPASRPAATSDDRLSVSLRASVVRRARSGRKRLVRDSARALRVRRGQRVAFTLRVRNAGDRRQAPVAGCVRLSSRFTLVSRGGGRVSAGRICFVSGSLNPARLLRRRFVVRIDRDARLGRLSVLALAASRQGARASARRTLSVRRAALRRRAMPPGVTG